MKNKTTRGFTLTELLITVFILAIAAVAVMPMLGSGDAEKLDLTATEVVNALRFTRAESMRRGGPIQGITLNKTTGIISLNNYNLSVAGLNLKANIDLTTQVFNPLDKKNYSFDLAKLPHVTGAKLGSITYKGAAQNDPVEIIFTASGAPGYAIGPGYQFYAMFPYQLPILIPVTLNGQTKNIQIDGTGRITIL